MAKVGDLLNKTGEKRSGIGKFHVLLHKENAIGKILMDADTFEGASKRKFQKSNALDAINQSIYSEKTRTL